MAVGPNFRQSTPLRMTKPPYGLIYFEVFKLQKQGVLNPFPTKSHQKSIKKNTVSDNQCGGFLSLQRSAGAIEALGGLKGRLCSGGEEAAKQRRRWRGRGCGRWEVLGGVRVSCFCSMGISRKSCVLLGNEVYNQHVVEIEQVCCFLGGSVGFWKQIGPLLQEVWCLLIIYRLLIFYV